MTAEGDAISALASTLDALDEHLKHSDAAVIRSERNRLSMLHVHALFGMAIGALFSLVGQDGMRGATWTVARMIPGAPVSLGMLLFSGGLILAVATMRRAVRWEMVGLWILLFWYTTVAVSFGSALFLWLGAGMPGGAAKPSMYGPLLYCHFSIIMSVHLKTLRKIRRFQLRGAT